MLEADGPAPAPSPPPGRPHLTTGPLLIIYDGSDTLHGIDAASLDASEQLAAEGAQLARKAGLTAEPRVASTVATAAEAIVDAANTLDARLIVLGSRGRRGVTAALLGSTSTNVLHPTHRPVLVIPATERHLV